MNSKETNPKDAIGSSKLPLDLVPATLEIYASLAFLDGALKYGKFNWRVVGVRVSIYLAAIKRHIAKFENGEWADPKTRVPHLSSILACAGIIVDAHVNENIIDDRPPASLAVSDLIDEMETEVVYLKEFFKGHRPHQYTIEDLRNDTGTDRRVLSEVSRQPKGEKAAGDAQQGPSGSGKGGDGPQGGWEGSGSQESSLERWLKRT
jgi:hypothetical protein